MLFVEKNTKIRIPKVYALYSNPAGRKQYIVVERIAGEALLSLWPTLSVEEKEVVTSTLREYFDELRQLPPRTDYRYGSLGNRYILDSVFWTTQPEPKINGLFTTREELIEAMARKYTYDGRPGYRAEYFRQCLPLFLRDEYGPKFTHADSQPKNLMIVKEGSALQVVVIDWEKAGWYPEYWEYGLAGCALRYDDDWCLCIGRALEMFVAEASWVKAICLELWS